MAKRCFFAVAFRPELNFFYLFVKRYLEETYGVIVERGDATILTKPLMDKIREQIVKADLVVGEVTGANANVFYEVGLAHALGKLVLFLTQESPEQAPVDIRQFEFIHYDLGKHEDFLAKLDTAIRGAFGAAYQDLYNEASALLQQFNGETGVNSRSASLEEFQARVMRGEQTGGIPPAESRELRHTSWCRRSSVTSPTRPSSVATRSGSRRSRRPDR